MPLRYEPFSTGGWGSGTGQTDREGNPLISNWITRLHAIETPTRRYLRTTPTTKPRPTLRSDLDLATGFGPYRLPAFYRPAFRRRTSPSIQVRRRRRPATNRSSNPPIDGPGPDAISDPSRQNFVGCADKNFSWNSDGRPAHAVPVSISDSKFKSPCGQPNVKIEMDQNCGETMPIYGEQHQDKPSSHSHWNIRRLTFVSTSDASNTVPRKRDTKTINHPLPNKLRRLVSIPGAVTSNPTHVWNC